MSSQALTLQGETRRQRLRPFTSRAPRAGTCRQVFRTEANKRVQKRQQVVLTADIASLGLTGEVKSVKVGYFRNWLYPQGLAKPATADFLKAIQDEKDREIKRKLEEKAKAQAFADALAAVGKFIVKKKAGDTGKIFGSVSKKEIAAAVFQQLGKKVEEEDIDLPEMKTLGSYDVPIKLHPEVTGIIAVELLKEKDLKISIKKA